MGEITLVRHGQASFGADNYDQLSELGQQQAHWLGEYWRMLEQDFDGVALGTLRRHQQTADGILSSCRPPQSSPPVIHAGLNEYNFRELLAALQRYRPAEWVETGQPKKDYYHNIRRALGYWQTGEIGSDGADSWDSFRARIHDAFGEISGASGRTLVVSSAGPIAVILAQVLQLDAAMTINLMLHIKNTSVSRILYNGRLLTLDSYNDVAHLQLAQRRHAITFS